MSARSEFVCYTTRRRRTLGLIGLIFVGYLLLVLCLQWGADDAIELDDVLLLALLYLIGWGVSAVSPAGCIKLGAEQMEMHMGKRLIFSMRYRDCARALRIRNGSALAVQGARGAVQVNDADWVPQQEGALPISAALAARLPESCFRKDSAKERFRMSLLQMKMLLCMPRFIIVFLLMISLWVCAGATLRNLHSQAVLQAEKVGCDEPSSSEGYVYITRKEYELPAGDELNFEFDEFTLRLTPRRVESPAFFTAMQARSGFCVLWHRLRGTMPAWEQAYKEYTEKKRWSLMSYPIGTPYWEYSVEPRSDRFYSVRFRDADGFSSDMLFESGKNGTCRGVLLKKPTVAEALLLIEAPEIP